MRTDDVPRYFLGGHFFSGRGHGTIPHKPHSQPEIVNIECWKWIRGRPRSQFACIWIVFLEISSSRCTGDTGTGIHERETWKHENMNILVRWILLSKDDWQMEDVRFLLQSDDMDVEKDQSLSFWSRCYYAYVRCFSAHSLLIWRPSRVSPKIFFRFDLWSSYIQLLPGSAQHILDYFLFHRFQASNCWDSMFPPTGLGRVARLWTVANGWEPKGLRGPRIVSHNRERFGAPPRSLTNIWVLGWSNMSRWNFDPQTF